MMRQLGLITLYGAKPSRFEKFIQDCQKILSSILEDSFAQYELGQIHGTIISLARLYEDSLVNLEFNKADNKLLNMNIIGYLDYIKNSKKLPVAIRIGAFKNNDAPFLSKGQYPYFRSFSIQGKKCIVIGWPIFRDRISTEEIYSDALGVIRSSGEKYNIRHIYNQPDFVDNEYCFRIGLVENTPSNKKLRMAEKRLRDYLSSIDPIILEIKLSDIFLVGYQDETLPIGSTKALPITAIRTTADIEGLLS